MGGASKDDLMDLLAAEKEAFALYERLCARYQIPPDPTAIAVSQAKIQLLEQLMTENTEPHVQKRITSLFGRPTKKSD